MSRRSSLAFAQDAPLVETATVAPPERVTAGVVKSPTAQFMSAQQQGT